MRTPPSVRRTTLVAAAALVTSTLLGAPVGASAADPPPGASQPHHARALPGSGTAAEAPDLAVAYLMRADGLSRAEAQRRIAAQPAQLDTAERLARQLGPDRTGGAYLDRRTGDLVVTVLGADAARVVAAAGARARTVRHSLSELSALTGRLDAMSTAGPAPGTSWGIDIERNAVLLRGATPATVRNLRSTGDSIRIEGDAGAMVTPTQNVHPGFTAASGDEPCTAGFTLRDTTGLIQYMLTAAHCVFSSASLTVNGSPLGDRVRMDTAHDVAVVRNLNPLVHVLGPFVWTYQQQFGWKTVIGVRSISPTQNFTYCKSGRSSFYTCGRLLRPGVSVSTKFGGSARTVFGLAETNICAVGGDSGGPLVLPTTDPGKVFASGVTQSARLYNSNGGPWAPGQTQFCGEQVTPPQPNFSYHQPLSVALAKVGSEFSVVTG